MNARLSATRGEWQQALEQSLVTFNGDAIEVSELLCALIAGLENRYDRDTLGDVQHEFEQLKEALEELEPAATVQDIREWQADRDQGNDIEEGDWK